MTAPAHTNAPARYFPVRDAPLTMAARLHPFGTDFGNGAADGRYFQLDREAERYRAEKRRTPRHRAGVLAAREDQRRAHRAVLGWIGRTLATEGAPDAPAALPPDDPARGYAEVAAFVQEDLTVLLRDASGTRDEAIAVHVDFPSGWRPERILGASFREIHGPVPAFADDPAQAASMVASMVDRGPYVRFVWTLAADDRLDHHPEEGRRRPWRAGGRGWLRVERQVTVPFPAERASLFLIRTYLYPFEDLSPEQRAILRRALELLPPDVARYKGLDGEAGAVARELLGR